MNTSIRARAHAHDPISGAGLAGPDLAGLSARELDVLRLAADGLDTGEIARKLSYSKRTVAGVVHDVVTRLGLRNRTHAVAYAVRAGLI